MQKHPVTVTRHDGSPARGATVQVVDHYSGDDLTLYEDDETTTKANPIIVGETGRVEFKIPNSVVDLVITSDTDTQTLSALKVSDGAELALIENGSGGTIAYGTVCYMATDGTMKIATNDGTEQQAKARWICITRGGLGDGDVGPFSGPGLVSGLTGGTTGSSAWLDTSGAITETQPAGSGDFSVYLGEWHSTTVLNFAPTEPSEIA